jgi:hypothetical protein
VSQKKKHFRKSNSPDPHLHFGTVHRWAPCRRRLDGRPHWGSRPISRSLLPKAQEGEYSEYYKQDWLRLGRAIQLPQLHFWRASRALGLTLADPSSSTTRVTLVLEAEDAQDHNPVSPGHASRFCLPLQFHGFLLDRNMLSLSSKLIFCSKSRTIGRSLPILGLNNCLLVSRHARRRLGRAFE